MFFQPVKSVSLNPSLAGISIPSILTIFCLIVSQIIKDFKIVSLESMIGLSFKLSALTLPPLNIALIAFKMLADSSASSHLS